MSVFTMPSLGADMEAGKLVEWLVKPGDQVRHGDVVAVVETQKGAIEIEVFDDGIVERLDAELGQTLPVGAALAEIRSIGEAAAAAPAAQPAAEVVEARMPAAAPTPVLTPAPTASPPKQRVAAGLGASPAARARAAELGIDLADIKGSGPGGAIVLADVTAPATEPAPTSAAPDRGAFIAEMRRAIAAAMTRSKREIPHYYVTHTVDLGAAMAWLDAVNAGRPPEERLLMGALLMKAVALAAASEAAFNGHFGPEGFHPTERVHLGLAVALRGGGLVAPAILDADRLSLAALMGAMRDLTARVRAGRLRSSEMNMATLTYSGLGETGVESMAGIIVPPQVALVTSGAPQPMALVRDGAVVARPAVTFTLAADHRVSDGRLGARFLSEIDQRLQSPEAL
ncbi:dihydrolipoamide acetyltransferase family protein [Solirhodobacter olei]|uniref:dihydrolipoamide acetyltransferase family protein n=1 Tax=Solirhodobacter olei TaxID=2493082 RepID=UPI000FDA8E49|nr:dihydrolipoamide acetyltransferase family protein [Solirhodobacter olei]